MPRVPCRRTSVRALIRTFALASAVAVVAVVASSQRQSEHQHQHQRQPRGQLPLLRKPRAQGDARGSRGENVGDASVAAALVAEAAPSRGQRQPQLRHLPQGQKRQPKPQPQSQHQHQRQGEQQKLLLRTSRGQETARAQEENVGKPRFLSAGGGEEETTTASATTASTTTTTTTTTPAPTTPRPGFSSPLLLENTAFSTSSPSSSSLASESDSFTLEAEVSYGGGGVGEEEEEDEEVTGVTGAGGGSGSGGGGISSGSKDTLVTGAVIIAGVAAVLVVAACLFAWCHRTAATSSENRGEDGDAGGRGGKKKPSEPWGRGMGPNPLVRGRPGALCQK